MRSPDPVLVHTFLLAILYGMAMAFNLFAAKNFRDSVRMNNRAKENYDASRKFVEDVYNVNERRLKAHGFVRDQKGFTNV